MLLIGSDLILCMSTCNSYCTRTAIISKTNKNYEKDSKLFNNNTLLLIDIVYLIIAMAKFTIHY